MSNDDGVRGKQWLEQFLQITGLSSKVTVDISKLETEGSCWLVIDPEALSPHQIESLIGNQGTGLDAIQYLANTILNVGCERGEQQAYTIELNGYRVQRQAELRDLAESAATNVRETGEEFEIKDLSSAERRQIHTLFQDWEDLETESRGKEPDRRL
ncbi:MAG: RNA-binding protein, partial [Merismopedia sp. SIO2A8]|nr:RNA-binding protein [Merismopedia sp. SIO2A8]